MFAKITPKTTTKTNKTIQTKCGVDFNYICCTNVYNSNSSVIHTIRECWSFQNETIVMRPNVKFLIVMCLCLYTVWLSLWVTWLHIGVFFRIPRNEF